MGTSGIDKSLRYCRIQVSLIGRGEGLVSSERYNVQNCRREKKRERERERERYNVQHVSRMGIREV